MLTLTVLSDGDRVPRFERVKCILKGARINDLFDTGGSRVVEDVLRSANRRFYSRSCFFNSPSPYVDRARNDEGADTYHTKRDE